LSNNNNVAVGINVQANGVDILAWDTDSYISLEVIVEHPFKQDSIDIKNKSSSTFIPLPNPSSTKITATLNQFAIASETTIWLWTVKTSDNIILFKLKSTLSIQYEIITLHLTSTFLFVGHSAGLHVFSLQNGVLPLILDQEKNITERVDNKKEIEQEDEKLKIKNNLDFLYIPITKNSEGIKVIQSLTYNTIIMQDIQDKLYFLEINISDRNSYLIQLILPFKERIINYSSIRPNRDHTVKVGQICVIINPYSVFMLNIDTISELKDTNNTSGSNILQREEIKISVKKGIFCEKPVSHLVYVQPDTLITSTLKDIPIYVLN